MNLSATLIHNNPGWVGGKASPVLRHEQTSFSNRPHFPKKPPECSLNVRVDTGLLSVYFSLVHY